MTAAWMLWSIGAGPLVLVAGLAAERVLDRGRRVVRRMTAGQARALTNAGTVSGGMIPKIDACLRALSNGSISQIIDGREPGALRRCLAGEVFGTRIG